MNRAARRRTCALHTDRPGRRAVCNCGFTLVEIMVTLVILSGGLLGMAYLQAAAVQHNQESFHRTQALNIGSQLIDQMRTALLNVGNLPNYRALDFSKKCDPESAEPDDYVICFFEKISATLPAGTARIRPDSPTANIFSVTIYWSDKGLSQQAYKARSEDERPAKSLDTKADCDAEQNRTWSDDVFWPSGSKPTAHTCLVSHSWEVHVTDPESLQFPVPAES